MSTQVDERIDTTTTTENQEPGDHERMAHFVRKEDILRATVEGKPVVALCGKVWVPNRDGQKFPVCPECQEIMDNVVGTNRPDGDR